MKVLHLDSALHRNPPREVKNSFERFATNSLRVRAARLRPLLLISFLVVSFSFRRLSLDMLQCLNIFLRLIECGMGLFMWTWYMAHDIARASLCSCSTSLVFFYGVDLGQRKSFLAT
jgi:hypothetical protein